MGGRGGGGGYFSLFFFKIVINVTMCWINSRVPQPESDVKQCDATHASLISLCKVSPIHGLVFTHTSQRFLVRLRGVCPTCCGATSFKLPALILLQSCTPHGLAVKNGVAALGVSAANSPILSRALSKGKRFR